MFKLDSRTLRRTALALGFPALVVFSGPSARTNKQAGLLLPHAANPMVIYGADTVTIDRNARDFKLPDQFEWKGSPGSASRTAALFGDPSKPGLYVQVTKRGPNEWSQPHSHPNERFITVLAGTFLIGTGAKFDKNNTVAVGPGGVVHDIPNQMHYDGTGPEGATLEFIATGPAVRNEAK
jgi:hypothetical protein